MRQFLRIGHEQTPASTMRQSEKTKAQRNWNPRQSRNPTTDITADGEVQTNEEAQVYNHDLELFVMEKILENTLAVLFFGTLCEGHCHAYEWASGQQPQPTKNGKTILDNTGNFVFIDVLKLEPATIPCEALCVVLPEIKRKKTTTCFHA